MVASSPSITDRAVYIPVDVPTAALRKLILRLVRYMEEESTEAASALVAELGALAESADDDSGPRVGRLRAAFLARTLLDLHQAGWTITLEDGQVYAVAPSFAHHGSVQLNAAKHHVRTTMEARVREQVATQSTLRLLQRVEPLLPKVIADGTALATALEQRGPAAIQPYLEPARVLDGDDPTTGVSRYDLFRYLRFLWNFPYSDTPGRTLPFLVRDAGQPGNPVCGLLCFSSPLLRLTSRDDDLGLTPAWLEAIAAGLDFRVDAATLKAGLVTHFEDLSGALRLRRTLEDTGLSPTRTFTDLGLLLGVDSAPMASDLGRALSLLEPAELRTRQQGACSRILVQLRDDLLEALRGIDLTDLDLELPAVLARPEDHLAKLEQLAKETTTRWKSSRSHGYVEEEEEDEEFSKDKLLFAKKRANQFFVLLKGWKGMRPIAALLEKPNFDAVVALREATSKRRVPWLEAERRSLTGGEGMDRGLTEALLQRKVLLAATRIMDVSVCGAVPPYNDLLGGKLAALLALSREAAATYFDAYSGRASDIHSKMVKASSARRADLVALTTTSFYAVGSSQYSRLSLPPDMGGLRWVEVGTSRGHGTLHFSAETCRLAALLLKEETGLNLITSTFGEGPSERLRKLRDTFSLLRLPADELLRHGMERLIFVAALSPATRPGLACTAEPHHLAGPTVGQLATFWQQRWLAGRLQDPARILALRAFDPRSVLISVRFPKEVALAATREAS